MNVNDDPAAYRRRPADVLAAVEIVLRDMGMSRLYRATYPRVGVLSVAAGVTAWCDGRRIAWRHDGMAHAWSASDPEGAALRLAELAGGAS